MLLVKIVIFHVKVMNVTLIRFCCSVCIGTTEYIIAQ